MKYRSKVQANSKKRANKGHKVPTFDWEGALEDLGEQYTSVDLQHEILKNREQSI